MNVSSYVYALEKYLLFCVYMFACVGVCVHVFVLACICDFTCMFSFVLLCMRACAGVYVCVHIYVSTYVFFHEYVYVYMTCVCMCVCVRVMCTRNTEERKGRRKKSYQENDTEKGLHNSKR